MWEIHTNILPKFIVSPSTTYYKCVRHVTKPQFALKMKKKCFSCLIRFLFSCKNKEKIQVRSLGYQKSKCNLFIAFTLYCYRKDRFEKHMINCDNKVIAIKRNILHLLSLYFLVLVGFISEIKLCRFVHAILFITEL